MKNLIITPTYKSYNIVKEICEAIDENTVYPYLHILVDDDSNCGEFPVQASEKRRILMVKRDYEGAVRKTGEGQAIQMGYDWAHHAVFNGQNNTLPYDHIFMIEADVIVKPEWDRKMIDVLATLPEDWLTLDVQSTNFEGKLVHPTTNWGSKVGDEREDLEVTYYPDFQCTLFNQRIFDSGVNFSFLVDPCDSCFGRAASMVLEGRHFRTKLVSADHYVYQSTRFMEKIKIENLTERVSDIDSYIFDEDLSIYHKYGTGLPNGSVILDVGTGKAKSAIALALTNARNRVITVDNGTEAVILGWAKSTEEYIRNTKRTIKNHGTDNCEFIHGDIFNTLSYLPKIDLFHLDDEDSEGDILEVVLPLVKDRGILLVRNYLRFKERVDALCEGYEYLEYGGLIQVIRKVGKDEK